MTRLEGDFFPAGSSERLTALLNIEDSGHVSVIALDRDQQHQLADSSFADLSISPRLGNTARHIQFKDGSNFETLNNDEVDQSLALFKQGKGYRFIHYLEKHSLFVLLTVVLVSGFIWGSIQYGIPVIADITAKALPHEVSQHLGKGTLEILDNTVFTASALPQQRQHELSSLFKKYSADFSDLNLTVIFRKGNEIDANAMALPDGHIIFTDELIYLSQDDKQLLAIYSHEVGHLKHRHMLRRVIQDSMLTALVVLITGDVSSASSIIFTLPALILELAYSREFESEADDFAYDFLIQNEISPEHFANIMKLLADEEKVERGQEEVVDKTHPEYKVSEDVGHYLSTHPATSLRIQKFSKVN